VVQAKQVVVLTTLLVLVVLDRQYQVAGEL
jgi:hypothetical protein